MNKSPEPEVPWWEKIHGTAKTDSSLPIYNLKEYPYTPEEVFSSDSTSPPLPYPPYSIGIDPYIRPLRGARPPVTEIESDYERKRDMLQSIIGYMNINRSPDEQLRLEQFSGPAKHSFERGIITGIKILSGEMVIMKEEATVENGVGAALTRLNMIDRILTTLVGGGFAIIEGKHELCTT